MITIESIVAKLRDRLARKCTAIELTHWAKGLMFDFYENKKSYDPTTKETAERAVLRIANSSTNYRTFMFDSEILKLLAHIGHPSEYQPPYPERYSINIILGQQQSAASQKAVKVVQDHLNAQHNFSVRQQGSGLVINADRLSEAEINQLAALLHAHSFIMSLKDCQQ